MTLLNGTMTPIQTVTVGAGGAATIDFTNIPQTYTDLVIYLSARSTQSNIFGGAQLRFNSNSTLNAYETRRLYGTGSSVESNTWSSGSDSQGILGWNVVGNNSTANTFSSQMIYIPNYAGSTHKSVSIDEVTENNATTAYAGFFAGIWKNTAAITSVNILANAGQTFLQHSTATLYGVRNYANNQTGAYATGGTVTTDGQYWYHTFTSSSTFTPSKNLSCDVLVIAGGGGGAGDVGAGAGAGGIIYQASRALASSTSFTVTVGAGGTRGIQGGVDPGTDGSDSYFDSLRAFGGAKGAVYYTNGTAGGSGSGGGGGRVTTAGTSNQTSNNGGTGYGNAGGAGTGPNDVAAGAGGGGGAGSVGSPSSGLSGGAGGSGLNIWSSWASATSTGVNGFYAGGGGGGSWFGTPGSGGAGGGGAGADRSSGGAAGSGTANTGGGGGGDGGGSPPGQGGNGGSGLVIVRYSVNS